MNCGALIFAHNNSKVDYVKLAVFSAKQVIKYLDIPVTLVTDNPESVSEEATEIFDKIIVIENSEHNQVKRFYDGTTVASNVEWKNFSRSQVYELTPYDKTLVIDSDYIINSSV
jgi:alpha-N-acetylglucosamine transferase